MILYLSGPITGVPDFEDRFIVAEMLIEEMGPTVINPAILPLGLKPADYMRISLAELEAADAVALLPGWERSRGAQIEVLSALYAGKKLFTYSDSSGLPVLQNLDAAEARRRIGEVLCDGQKLIATWWSSSTPTGKPETGGGADE